MKTFFRLPPCLRHVAIALTTPSSCSRKTSLRFSTSCDRTNPTIEKIPRRSYDDALVLLKSLQSNQAIRASISDAPINKNRDAIPEMIEWARKAGYQPAELANSGFRCIHIAGTKGKGSVCVMVENILLQYRDTEVQQPLSQASGHLHKIGLYTSPHLVTVRERIRINGSPISNELFTRYFFELWDRFESAAPRTSKDSDSQSSEIEYTLETRPGYFRYLTLLAFHAFAREGVGTAIIECGIGGEYDSTNILPPEAVAVTAITKLGIDHTTMLGETIDEIAWHKAGIFKRGVPAITTRQYPEAQAVLEKRARGKGVELAVMDRVRAIDQEEIRLGLLGDFQKDNASLAIAVASSYLQSIGIIRNVPLETDPANARAEMPVEFTNGLETVSWPGRCQIIKDENLEWFIDGAHTLDSIEAVAIWYYEKVNEAFRQSKPPIATMLVFNQAERDGALLLRRLLSTLLSLQSDNKKVVDGQIIEIVTPELGKGPYLGSFPTFRFFNYAAFCTNEPFKIPSKREDLDLEVQSNLAHVYEQTDHNPLHAVYGSVEEAVRLAHRVVNGDERLLVLVTGSLHLVGGMLQVLERQAWKRQSYQDNLRKGKRLD